MTDKKQKVDLQSLYPTALTSTEEYEKNLERRLRLPTPPRFARLKVALALGCVCFLLFLIMFNLAYFWSMGLSGITASFLIMIVVGIGGKFALSYTATIFDMYAKGAGAFLILCVVLIGLLMVAVRLGWLAGLSAPLTALILSSIFTVLSLTVLGAILRRP